MSLDRSLTVSTIIFIAFVAAKPLQWLSRPALLGPLTFNVNCKRDAVPLLPFLT